jgi:hypothetical protein
MIRITPEVLCKNKKESEFVYMSLLFLNRLLNFREGRGRDASATESVEKRTK